MKYSEDGTLIEKGNCWATVIACLLETKIEYVPNIEELFDCCDYFDILQKWLHTKGFEYVASTKEECESIDDFYMVSGKSPRGSFNHIVIYKNGQLVHDPHPSGDGILTEDYFERLIKISNDQALPVKA